MIAKRKIYHVLGMIIWSMIFIGISAMLISAVKKETATVCKDVKIRLTNSNVYAMLDDQEILMSLWPNEKDGLPINKMIESFDLFKLEKHLEKNPWVYKADLYFDNLNNLHIDVQQRTPIARVFTPDGNSFYMDSMYAILPIKSNQILSLPVFTNFFINPSAASSSDSSILKRMVSLSSFILSDSLWMAQVEGININSDSNFELSTQVGDQSIMLGNRDDWKNVFKKLAILYQHFNDEGSWDRYSKIDLQFKDQVVCVKQNQLPSIADSTNLIDSLNLQNGSNDATGKLENASSSFNQPLTQNKNNATDNLKLKNKTPQTKK